MSRPVIGVEVSGHTESKACGVDVGFGFPCRRERGHVGFHTWDPKRLLGEEPLPITDELRTDDQGVAKWIAILKPLGVKPLQRPNYKRWDLVRTNDRDAWVRENRELLMGWYNDTNAYAEMPEDFAAFAEIQFDLERAHFEELRADARLDHDYIDREEG